MDKEMNMAFNLSNYRVGLFAGREARRNGTPIPNDMDCESYQIGVGDGYFGKGRR
jgi:hypothetical protein